MIELFERNTGSNDTADHITDASNQRVIARCFTLCQVQSLMAGQVTKAILTTAEENQPGVGDHFIGYIGNTYSRASIVVEADITDVCSIHIDLSDSEPLWLAGEPAGRTQRDNLGKDLGFSSWQQFARHYVKHSGRAIFNGVVISWEQS